MQVLKAKLKSENVSMIAVTFQIIVVMVAVEGARDADNVANADFQDEEIQVSVDKEIQVLVDEEIPSSVERKSFAVYFPAGKVRGHVGK